MGPIAEPDVRDFETGLVGDDAGPRGGDQTRSLPGRTDVDGDLSEVSRRGGSPGDTSQGGWPAHGPRTAAAQIGRFTVLEPIGRGGMGMVYAAYDGRLDRKVAIKVLLDDECVDPEARRRFQREAQAMARVSHPNVVKVHEVGLSDGEVFMAMEFIRGQSLVQWLRTEPSWSQVLEVFVQAGEGLVAAHEAGLVHRDLKPHNIMRDEDGLVKVLDFGLARAASGELDEPLGTGSDSDSGSDSVLRSSLTQTGTVMGTPAYMSPEQLRAQAADARSDQFSFCVALYEGLYGERPFAGTSEQALSEQALMDAMVRDGVRPASKARKVPTAVRKVLLRGLALDPDKRWPSMKALLEPLRTRLAPRRRRWVALSLGIGALGLGMGIGVDRYTAWADRCTGATRQLRGIWDDGRKPAVEAAILGTALSYAPDTWGRVERGLDEYAAAWVDAYTDACEATAVRHEQSEEHMGQRMSCLRQRQQHLRATIDELTHADPTTVEHAVEAVTSLPGLSRCADMEALAATVPPPEDPAVAERVIALDDRLVEARTKQRAGRYDKGLLVAEAVVSEATTLGYEPLLARAWLRQGTLQRATGDYEGAVTTLQRAYELALARTLTVEAADAATRLVSVLGSDLARPAEARRWAVHADPLSRAAAPPQVRARFLHSLGVLASSQGEYDEARDQVERALAIFEQVRGPDHPDVASALGSLGTVSNSLGEYDQAREHLQRMLAILRKALGPEHPHVAGALSNLAVVTRAQGRYDEAHDYLQRALAIVQEALGPEHPHVAKALNNLGVVAEERGEYDEARDWHERALATMEEALGPRHPKVAFVLNSLGILAAKQGEPGEARDCFDRALDIQHEALGLGHPQLVFTLTNLGNVTSMQGRHREAHAWYAEALAIQEATLGPSHPEVAFTLTNLGQGALSQGQPDDARRWLERSLAIKEAALGPEHPDLVSTLSSLSGVASMGGEHQQARELLDRALRIQHGALGRDHPEVAKTLVMLGNTHLALGEPTEAVSVLERALTLADAHDVGAALPAEIRFVLARALWVAPSAEGRDRGRARTLAEQARDALATGDVPDPRDGDLAQIERWLAEHRVRSNQARVR